MRVVRSPEELDEAIEAAKREAKAGFGDDTVFFERYVERSRHVEVQVVGDRFGSVLVLGERDCSLQRRHQKVVEECPSPIVSPALRRRLGQEAVALMHAAGYVNAGTCEFLLDQSGEFYFLEMNTRLQVEHPVTELVTGIDLAHAQLAVAAGEGLLREGRADLRGHAIEFRINAEDPAEDFRPAPGRVSRFRPPLGPGVRVDTHVEEGYAIPPFYDSLIAKVIVWGEDREVAIARGRRALSELELEGIPTTRALALDIVSSEEFGSGDYTTSVLADEAPSLASLRGGAA